MRVVRKYGAGLPKCVRQSRVKAQLSAIRALRTCGMTYKEIGAKLGCSASSVCLALEGAAAPPAVRARLRRTSAANISAGPKVRDRRARAQRLVEYAAAQQEAASPRDMFMAALYAGEGNKGGYFAVTNSNPSTIKFVVDYYRLQRQVPAERMALDLSLHSDADAEAARRFWEKLTGLPVAALHTKPSTQGKRHTTYKLPYGTVLFRLKDALARGEFERMRGLCMQVGVEIEPKRFKGEADVFWKMHSS